MSEWRSNAHEHMTLDEARLLLTNMSACPLCLGTGKMAVNDTYLVTCWECHGKGHRYERTVTT